METFSALLALCAGNSPVTGEFPAQRPVARCFDVFFDLRLNQQLSKQWRRRWFETQSRLLWRHCNDLSIHILSHEQFSVNGFISKLLNKFCEFHTKIFPDKMLCLVTNSSMTKLKHTPYVYMRKSVSFEKDKLIAQMLAFHNAVIMIKTVCSMTDLILRIPIHKRGVLGAFH